MSERFHLAVRVDSVTGKAHVLIAPKWTACGFRATRMRELIHPDNVPAADLCRRCWPELTADRPTPIGLRATSEGASA